MSFLRLIFVGLNPGQTEVKSEEMTPYDNLSETRGQFQYSCLAGNVTTAAICSAGFIGYQPNVYIIMCILNIWSLWTHQWEGISSKKCIFLNLSSPNLSNPPYIFQGEGIAITISCMHSSLTPLPGTSASAQYLRPRGATERNAHVTVTTGCFWPPAHVRFVDSIGKLC